MIIYWQSNNWNVKFSIIYLKCCSGCCRFHFLRRWVTNCSKCPWYFRCCTTFCPSRPEFYLVYLVINSKSRDLQKLHKYLNGTASSASNMVLQFSVLPIIFALYSKNLLAIVLLLLILLLALSFSFSSSFTSSL